MYTYKATVTAVYDGDSITIDLDMGFSHFQKNMKIRVSGVDTPEVRTRNTLEKLAGTLVQKYVEDLICDKDIIIKTIKDKGDKYGRMLGRIYLEDLYLTDDLIDKGLGKTYSGGKKEKWTDEELNHIINTLQT